MKKIIFLWNTPGFVLWGKGWGFSTVFYRLCVWNSSLPCATLSPRSCGSALWRAAVGCLMVPGALFSVRGTWCCPVPGAALQCAPAAFTSAFALQQMEGYLCGNEQNGKYFWSWKELIAGLKWDEFSVLGKHIFRKILNYRSLLIDTKELAEQKGNLRCLHGFSSREIWE